MRKFAFIAAMLASSFAFAGQVRLNANSFGTTPGGEFILTVTDGFDSFAPGTQFRSYCLEMNEYVRNGGTYYVEVNTAAVSGGVGGGNPDPLDRRSAYLYSQFAASVHNHAGADALQKAFWTIEQEANYSSHVIGDVFGIGLGAHATIGDLIAWADAHAPQGIGNVRVLNMYNTVDSRGRMSGHAQDMLMAVVPAPAAGLLGGLGLSAIAALRRRLA